MAKSFVSFNAEFWNQNQTDTLVVGCLDFRLQPWALQIAGQTFGCGHPDYRTVKGGPMCLASQEESHARFSLIEDIEFAVEKHGVKHLVLLNHTGCGAYKAAGHAFSDPDAERRFHREELQKAGEWACSHFHGDIHVSLGFIRAHDTGLFIEPVRLQAPPPPPQPAFVSPPGAFAGAALAVSP